MPVPDGKFAPVSKETWTSKENDKEEGRRLLKEAVSDGNVEQAEFVLKSYGLPATTSLDENLSPILLAARENHPEMVQMLLANGATPKKKKLVYDISTSGKSFRSSKIIFNFKRDYFEKDFDDKGAIHYAAEHQDSRMLQILLDYDKNHGRNDGSSISLAENCTEESPLFLAFIKGCAENVRILANDPGVRLEAFTDFLNELVTYHFETARKRIDVQKLQYLLEGARARPSGERIVRDWLQGPRQLFPDRSFTPLTSLCDWRIGEPQNMTDVIRVFVRNGCPVDTIDSSGEGLVELCLRRNNLAALRQLCIYNAPLPTISQASKIIPLHKVGSLAAFKMLQAVGFSSNGEFNKILRQKIDQEESMKKSEEGRKKAASEEKELLPLAYEMRSLLYHSRMAMYRGLNRGIPNRFYLESLGKQDLPENVRKFLLLPLEEFTGQ